MKRTVSLIYGGEAIANWRLAPGFKLSFGTPFAVQWQGRLTLFRAMRWEKDKIFLARFDS